MMITPSPTTFVYSLYIDKIDLRGQFTIHRNDPKIINQLWRPCSYLSDMDTRFFAEESLQFESAEGW